MDYTVTVDDSLVPALDATALQLGFPSTAAFVSDIVQQRATFANQGFALSVALSQVPVTAIQAAARAKGPFGKS